MAHSTVTPLRIFLSYSSEQAEVGTQLYLSLKNTGHDVFFDRASLQPGEEYNQAIVDAIRTSDRFIFLISPQSLRVGSYTRSELQFAEAAWPAPAGRVLPVLAVPVDFSEIPSYLKAVTILRPQGNLVAEVIANVNWQATGISPGETVLGKLTTLEAEQAQQAREGRISALDRRWEAERRKYSVQMNGRDMNITVEPWMAIIVLAFSVAMSIFGYVGFTARAPDFFGPGPVLFPLILGIVGTPWMWFKALEFKRKDAEYRRKRRLIMSEDGGPVASRVTNVEDYFRNLR